MAHGGERADSKGLDGERSRPSVPAQATGTWGTGARPTSSPPPLRFVSSMRLARIRSPHWRRGMAEGDFTPARVHAGSIRRFPGVRRFAGPRRPRSSGGGEGQERCGRPASERAVTQGTGPKPRHLGNDADARWRRCARGARGGGWPPFRQSSGSLRRRVESKKGPNQRLAKVAPFGNSQTGSTGTCRSKGERCRSLRGHPAGSSRARDFRRVAREAAWAVASRSTLIPSPEWRAPPSLRPWCSSSPAYRGPPRPWGPTPHPTWSCRTRCAIHYKLELTVDPERERYAGTVAIEVELARPTLSLWLHARDLDLGRVTVEAAGESLDATLTQVSPDGAARLRTQELLPVGRSIVHIAFEGSLLDGAVGLVRARAGATAMPGWAGDVGAPGPSPASTTRRSGRPSTSRWS